ncbi:MAG: DUF2911 domain-containing protein [Gemmatimonadetes bacterium]|nr:DUF2911 domain-containing protein [Gemmatimonadota bacterium]
MTSHSIRTPWVVAVFMLLAVPAAGQIRASESTVVEQTIDGTTLRVEYSRPSARGRELFGSVVPWNVVWTPGANWATTLETSKPIRANGVDIPAGRYSMWMTLRPDRWRLSLDPNDKLFHFQKPDSSVDQIHIAVTPKTGSHVEMLTWSFPSVSGDGAVLQMQWGTTVVPIQLVVTPSRPIALESAERQRYLGSFDLQFAEFAPWPRTGRFDVIEKDGRLRARWPFPMHPGDDLEFDLVPAGTDRFHAGLYRDGRLFNVEIGAAFEFIMEGDRAAGVRVRGIEGTVFGEGMRIPG